MKNANKVNIPYSVAFGKYLRAKRLEKNLSQSDVAKFLGYNNGQFISNWERGKVSPGLEALIKIASLYNIPEDEIIDEVERLYRTTLKASFKASKKKRKS